MNTVTVSASRRYDILIERGLLRRAGELVRGVTNAGTVMLVSDDSVWPLYGEAVQKSLADAGVSVCRFVFPHGEGSKCAKTYLALLDALCENRLTRADAALALGGVCMQLLEREGISIRARILSIGHARDSAPFDAPVAEKPFPAVSDDAAAAMQAEIAQAKADGDSVGGVVECVIDGLPAGIGEPMFGGLENLLARAVFAIPAIKGVEFGAGFAAARLRGSEHNDAFRVQDGRIVTETNRCGGILGGISTGMPVVFRAAFKPTPSISRQQDSVSLSRMENTTLVIHGRHDPCIVPRAVPCVEAAAAIAVLDAWMGRKKELGYAF